MSEIRNSFNQSLAETKAKFLGVRKNTVAVFSGGILLLILSFLAVFYWVGGAEAPKLGINNKSVAARDACKEAIKGISHYKDTLKIKSINTSSVGSDIFVDVEWHARDRSGRSVNYQTTCISADGSLVNMAVSIDGQMIINKSFL